MPLEIAYALEPGNGEEIAYHIRLIEVERDAKNPSSLKMLPSTRLLYESTLKTLAAGKDKAPLIALIKEEASFITKEKGFVSKETQAFNKIRVSKKRGEELLSEIALTGKLYFKGKSLLFDPLTPAEFFLTFSESQDVIQVKPLLIWAGKEIELSEVDLILPLDHAWVIKGMLLKPLMNSKKIPLPYQWVKPFITQSVKELSREEARDYFENEDEDLPRLVKAATLNLEEKPIECLPFLRLMDRSGAFANLFFDYGRGLIVGSHDFKDYILDERTKKKIPRKRESEKGWENDLLETDFIKKIVGASHYYCPLDKVSKSLSFLLDCGWTIFDHLGNRIVRYISHEIAVDESSDEQKILLKGAIYFENYQADLSQIVGAFNRREQFIQLGNGYTGLMATDGVSKDLAFLGEAESVGQEITIRKNRLGTFEDLFLKNSSESKTMEALKSALHSFHGIKEINPDPTFCGNLRDYQKEGLNWLNFLYTQNFHGLLADDMGLGKTVQVIAFLSTISSKLPHLIVVPTSLLFNWKQEFLTFLPTVSLTIHHGLDRLKTKEELQNCHIILTSYGVLRQERLLFEKLDFECLILDESHLIKNPSSQTAQTIFQMKANFRLSLSGTPVENKLEELWSQFHFLMPDLLGKEQEFNAALTAGASDSRFKETLKRKIRPFILRRTKESVAKELPEKIEQVMWVEMTTEQKNYYETFLGQAKSGLLKKVHLEGVSKHRLEIFETLLRLRQICCHPFLYPYKEGVEEMGSGKLELLLTELETLREEKKKVLIYSQFTSMLQLISKELRAKGDSPLLLDGSTKNREAVVNQFQNDPSLQFFLISLKAGGVGLNLTAADIVILFDPWWNEAVENQAIDRAHRIGQTKCVVAKRYVTIESIEEKMMKLKSHKNELVKSLFADSDSTHPFTIDDLEFLLS